MSRVHPAVPAKLLIILYHCCASRLTPCFFFARGSTGKTRRAPLRCPQAVRENEVAGGYPIRSIRSERRMWQSLPSPPSKTVSYCKNWCFLINSVLALAAALAGGEPRRRPFCCCCGECPGAVLLTQTLFDFYLVNWRKRRPTDAPANTGYEAVD